VTRTGYKSAEPLVTKRVGWELEKRPVWGVVEIDAREDWLVDAALQVFELSGRAKARAANLPSVRERVYRWRADGDVRTWLAIEDGGPDFLDLTAGYTCSVQVPAVREVVAGDSIAVYRPAVAAAVSKGRAAEPMRIVASGVVDRVEDLGDRKRRIVYRSGSHVEVTPYIPVAGLAGDEPVVEGRPKFAALSPHQASALNATMRAQAGVEGVDVGPVDISPVDISPVGVGPVDVGPDGEL
jgi:hypothetical protein